MDVMTAGVAHPGDLGGKGQTGALPHGQGVHVRAQRNPVVRVRGTHLAEQPRAGQQAR